MAVKADWQDGDDVHGSDINSLAAAVNSNSDDIGVLGWRTDQQPTNGYVTTPRLLHSDVSLSTGELLLSYAAMDRELPITNLTVFTGAAAASGVSLARFGVYLVSESDALTLIAATTNDTGLCAAPYTPYDVDLATGVTLHAGSRYAFAALFVASGMPSLAGVYVQPYVCAFAPRLTGVVFNQVNLPSTISADAVSNNWRYLTVKVS